MSLVIAKEIVDARSRCEDARRGGMRVAFVPTMGALHEGHLRLVDAAREKGGFVAVSVFVNPAQFGPGEDFDKYPRDLDGDASKLRARGVDLVFAPPASAMYPEGARTKVSVSEITRGLCGAHRPGHFDGVATVVTKLFNIIGPCAAVFGRKDYQQLQVVKRLVADLDMQVEVVGVPTVREGDGLALSSRNAYLSADERRRGVSISRGLSAAHALFRSGERSSGALRLAVSELVEKNADGVDYISVADPDSLREFSQGEDVSARALIAVAARFGKTRLIDNTVLGEDAPPLGLGDGR
jgi:pantoate--beta-alanine ligase